MGFIVRGFYFLRLLPFVQKRTRKAGLFIFERTVIPKIKSTHDKSTQFSQILTNKYVPAQRNCTRISIVCIVESENGLSCTDRFRELSG